jgi:hypothetical protein
MRSVLRFSIAEKSPVQSRVLGSTNRWPVKLCASEGETDPIAKARRLRRVAIRVRIGRALAKKLLTFASNRCCSKVRAGAAVSRRDSIIGVTAHRVGGDYHGIAHLHSFGLTGGH